MVTPAQSRLIDAQLTPARVGRAIDAAVASKALDAQKQEGAEVLKLLDGAAGIQAGDPLVAKATGLGGMLDVTA